MTKMEVYDLYELCVSNNWFTCGSNRQYNKMFELSEQGISLKELARIIWLCSDETIHTQASIYNILKSKYRG